MNNLSMNNMNSLERLEFEFKHTLPMTQRERLAVTEVFRLRKELEAYEKKAMAKNRSKDTGDA